MLDADVEMNGGIVVSAVVDMGMAIDERKGFSVADVDLDGGTDMVGLNEGVDVVDELIEILPGPGGDGKGGLGGVLDDAEDGLVLDGIELVKEHEGGDLVALEIGEDLSDDIELVVGAGAGGVDDDEE